MIDPTRETLLSYRQAAAIPLPDGRRVHWQTIRRWVRHGLRGVRLERYVIGRWPHTSREALDRFHAALNRPPEPVVTSRQRKRNHDRAEKFLDSLGVGR